MRGALGGCRTGDVRSRRGPWSAGMTSLAATQARPATRSPAWRPALVRHRGVLITLAVFAVLFGTVVLVSGFSSFQFSFIASGGAALALATIGQTVVVLTGGFDLSAGAVISLVNVVLGTGPGRPHPLLQRHGRARSGPTITTSRRAASPTGGPSRRSARRAAARPTDRRSMPKAACGTPSSTTASSSATGRTARSIASSRCPSRR